MTSLAGSEAGASQAKVVAACRAPRKEQRVKAPTVPSFVRRGELVTVSKGRHCTLTVDGGGEPERRGSIGPVA